MNTSVANILENFRKDGERMKSWAEVVRAVKDEIEEKGYSDVGDRADIRLGCTRKVLDAVILSMILKGYRYKVDVIERDGVKTQTYVLREGELK